MTQWGLDNLFNPGKRHMDDEKRRLQSTREEIGDNSGGRRIDLEGGKVSISVPRRPAPPADDEDAADDAAPAETAPADLDAALEAEEVPAVALGSDETEIEPVLVDDSAGAAVAEPQPVAAEPEPEPVVEPAVAAEPEPEPDPEPEPTPAPARRRTLSANAWSRRG